MMQELEIVITAEGTVRLDVKGVSGSDCLMLTEDLEKQLGIVTDRQMKSEYFQTSQGNVNRQWLQGGD